MFAIVSTPEHMARVIGQNTLPPHTITHGMVIGQNRVIGENRVIGQNMLPRHV